MTPKEKAKELVDKFNKIHTLNNYEAKQCALIAVDECLKCCIGFHVKLWQEVKKEIEKL